MRSLMMASAVALIGLMPAMAQDAATQEAPAGEAPAAAPTGAVEVPAGTYKLDKAHASLLFRVDHLGFSKYVGRFKTFDAELQFDPAAPADARVSVTVDANSLDVENPPPGFLDELKGPQWLDTAQYPEMKFETKSVEVTGEKTARILGDFTMHGVTKPVLLEATFNGGYAGHEMDPQARIGFSARGQLLRSAFGVAYGVPAPGTTMGVSDAVEIMIEAEFSGPPLAKTEPAPIPPG